MVTHCQRQTPKGSTVVCICLHQWCWTTALFYPHYIILISPSNPHDIDGFPKLFPSSCLISAPEFPLRQTIPDRNSPMDPMSWSPNKSQGALWGLAVHNPSHKIINTPFNKGRRLAVFSQVWQPMFNAMMMSMMGKGSGKNGLRNFTTDRKVWVSGMPADNASKEVNMKLKELGRYCNNGRTAEDHGIVE